MTGQLYPRKVDMIQMRRFATTVPNQPKGVPNQRLVLHQGLQDLLKVGDAAPDLRVVGKNHDPDLHKKRTGASGTRGSAGSDWIRRLSAQRAKSTRNAKEHPERPGSEALDDA